MKLKISSILAPVLALVSKNEALFSAENTVPY
jgi:hypothetical protein